MERLLDERRRSKVTTQVNHTHIEKMVAVAKIAEVYKITLVAGKDGIAVLQVAVYGCIFIGSIGDEAA